MTASITLTPYADASPCPRMEVLVDDLDAGVAYLTLTRTAEGRTHRVRGAVRVPVSSGFQTLDVECGFNTPSTYRAETFDSAGDSLGFIPVATETLEVEESWVHNPLDPQNAIAIDIADTSGRALSRPVNGEFFRPEQRVLAMLVSGQRYGLDDVDLFFSTDDTTVAAKFEAMFGGYDEDAPQVPVLCVRTPGFLDVPRTFYAGVLTPRLRPINVHMGGNLREWDASATETAPPFPGWIVPLLTRDDIDAAFATRDDLDAAYASRLAIDRDFAKAGTA